MTRFMRVFVGRAAVSAATLALAACTQIVDAPADPQVVASGPWRCLDEVTTSSTAATTEASVSVPACDFIKNCTTRVSGLTANLCDKRDVGCINPRISGIPDVNGQFSFQVPTAGGGFDGYLQVFSEVALCTDAAAFGAVAGAPLCSAVAPSCEMQNVDERCALPLFAPAMLFFNPPVIGNMQALPLQLLPSAGLPALISAAGIELDPASGSLFIQALDCDGEPASGVRYEIREHATKVSSLYVDNGLVSSSAKLTDTTGVGGFVGVPPGFVSVTGYTSDGVRIGEISVQAAASVLTYSALIPSP